jgi:hypothetical protein
MSKPFTFLIGAYICEALYTFQAKYVMHRNTANDRPIFYDCQPKVRKLTVQKQHDAWRLRKCVRTTY